jgi:hypothetical protein
VIQLLHRIVHPIESKPESISDCVAPQQHDELEPKTNSLQHASAAQLDITELANAPDPGPNWSLLLAPTEN